LTNTTAGTLKKELDRLDRTGLLGKRRVGNASQSIYLDDEDPEVQ